MSIPPGNSQDRDSSPAGALQDDEGCFELFEPGNPWTQKVSTQVQRKAWRKEVYMNSDEASPESGAILINDDDDKSAVAEGAEGQGEAQREQRSDPLIPWWTKGKVAPLLSDFDSSRRMFYLAQAGVGSDSTSRHHTHQGRQGRSSNQTRVAALSLAGNANSASIDTATSSHIAITPRKKTWDATWGQDGERSSKKGTSAATPKPSNLKRRRSTPSKTSKPMRGRLSGRN